jgi:hypothetical protein
MFKLPYIALGLTLFLIGMAITSGFIAFGLTLVGCYVLSRIMAHDYSVPAFFIIGIVAFGFCFFMASPLLQEIGLDRGTSNVIRLFTTLASGVLTWLSVPK